MALANAAACLHQLLRKYDDHLTPEEIAAAELLIETIGNLEDRIEQKQPAPE